MNDRFLSKPGGTILPVLDRTFPLDDVAAAYDYARTGRPNGNFAAGVR